MQAIALDSRFERVLTGTNTNLFRTQGKKEAIPCDRSTAAVKEFIASCEVHTQTAPATLGAAQTAETAAAAETAELVWQRSLYVAGLRWMIRKCAALRSLSKAHLPSPISAAS